MKKTILLCVFLPLVIANYSYSQGWVGNGGNNLSAFNSTLATSPINVGIGTNTPTSQFHTTGSVRHENLIQSNNQNQILVTDVFGNVYWRDVSTIGSQNAWLINGNLNTNSTVHFLGTTDNQNLSIRTNNTLRMTVLGSNGNVGIGVANPQVRLHISDNPGTMTGFPYENVVIERGGDMKLGIYSSVDSAKAGGASLMLGHTNVLNLNGRYPGFEMQYGASNNDINYFLRFNYTQRNVQGLVTASQSNILVIDDIGRVGINLGPTQGFPVLPTARFHTFGTVRFENLPAGSGVSLVVDNNGNVFRSVGFDRENASESDIKELRQAIKQLKDEIDALKMVIANRSVIKEKSLNTFKAILYQNAPNPFSQSTVVRYSIPKFVNNASIIVSDIKGMKIAEFNLKNKDKGHILINANQFSAGTYTYSLITDGALVDSKKMVLTH